MRLKKPIFIKELLTNTYLEITAHGEKRFCHFNQQLYVKVFKQKNDERVIFKTLDVFHDRTFKKLTKWARKKSS